MVEISRIKKSMQNKRFLKYILGAEEYAQLEKNNFPAQSIAANFCAKEAFSKALGTGVRGFKIKNVQVLRDCIGKPYIFLTEDALKIAEGNNLEFSVSLTHTKIYACAVVVCFNKE
jgi:holo-[acyl-carrier protein] synthase